MILSHPVLTARYGSINALIIGCRLSPPWPWRPLPCRPPRNCVRRLILMRCSCLCLRCLRYWPSKRRQNPRRARWVALLESFSVGEPHLWVSGPLDQFCVVYLVQNVEKTDWVVYCPSRCERHTQKFFVKETTAFVKDGPYKPSAHFRGIGLPHCIYVSGFQHSEYFQQLLMLGFIQLGYWHTGVLA